MRFYYQSSDSQTGQKVATKCIRVSSTATTKLIIENLIEKFRPDMKMLEVRPIPHNSPIYNENRIQSSKALEYLHLNDSNITRQTIDELGEVELSLIILAKP